MGFKLLGQTGRLSLDSHLKTGVCARISIIDRNIDLVVRILIIDIRWLAAETV